MEADRVKMKDLLILILIAVVLFLLGRMARPDPPSDELEYRPPSTVAPAKTVFWI